MRLKFRYIIALALVISYQVQWQQVQVIMMFIYSILILWADFKNFCLRRFDISTVYAGLLMLTTIAHGLALFGLTENPWFFIDVYSGERAGTAIFIFNLGGIFTMEAMRAIIKGHIERERAVLVETITKHTFNVIFFFSILIFVVTANFKTSILSLGALGAFVLMMVNGSVFLLSFIANSNNKNVYLVVVYTLFLSIWALKFSYLRMEILIPIVSYLGGDILANRSLRRMHLLSKALVISSLIIFPPLFTFLGENRSKVYGQAKLEQSLVMFRNNEMDEEGQSVMSRMSVIPQLSKIIMLTEKKGFYNGQTLNYLGYVFIPRFLWPEKPLIMQGQWFALEIGAAYKKKDGRANNSVNMTVPGEFYLNFGWTGVVVGCLLFGFFIGWLWNQTTYETLIGWGFRFYLLFLGLFSLGADLQIIPSLIAYWLIYRFLMFIRSQRSSATPAINNPLSSR